MVRVAVTTNTAVTVTPVTRPTESVFELMLMVGWVGPIGEETRGASVELATKPTWTLILAVALGLGVEIVVG